MDTKKYTIVIEGIKESINDVKSLKEVIESVTEKVEIEAKTQASATKEEKAATESKKERKQVTDELGKVQEKLTQFDKEYALEVARAKAELKSQNDEVKKAVQAENDLKVIEEQTLITYRDKQNYLTSLNRTIRQMSDEDTVAGKSKEQLKKISEAVQLSLKNEDAEMAIYVRNVGNYASAVDGFADHMEEVKMSLDDIITAITNGGELDFNVPDDMFEGGISGAKSLKAELKELQGQMAQMLADGVSPTDEAFLKLAERAGQLKDAMGDASAAVGHFASDTAALDNVVNLATTATASFGLLTSTMSVFGIQNEEVARSIEKLQAVQTALNSLQALSKSLCDNSTASYQLYHKALQMVGLEKVKETAQTTAQTSAKVAETAAQTAQNTATTAGAASTAALAAAEGTEAVAAGTAAVATGSFAAALWAALAPLLAIVAIVGVVAAGIYGLVEAYNWLFGPTEEETKAMEAQTQAMMQLNSKTQENIELLQSKGATEAQVLTASIQNYQDNITKLEEYLQKCKDFYGEDSDEYKKALEEKQKAQDSFDKANLKGLQYLNKQQAKYHDLELKRTLGETEYKKRKAKEEYDYQIQLLNELIKNGKIADEEAKQLRKDLEEAYKLSLKIIDNPDEANPKPSKTKTSSSTSRGTGGSGSKGESEAEKAAKEFKKAAEELAKAVEQMQKTTTDALLNQQKNALSKAEALAKQIEIINKKSYEDRLDAIDALEIQETNITAASYELRQKELDKKWAETREKYKKHTDLLLKYEAEYTSQTNLLTLQRNEALDEVGDKYDKQREAAYKEWLKKRGDYMVGETNKTIGKLQLMIDSALSTILDSEQNSLEDMQLAYQDMIPQLEKATDDVTASMRNSWTKFWAMEPDTDRFVFAVEQMYSTVEGESNQMQTMVEDFANYLSEHENITKELQKLYSFKPNTQEYENALNNLSQGAKGAAAQLQMLGQENADYINELISLTQTTSDKEYGKILDDLVYKVNDFSVFLKQEKANVDDLLSDTDGLSVFQQQIVAYYSESLKFIEQMGATMRAEGKSEEEITQKMSQAYYNLTSEMGYYKKSLIDAGKVVGDFETKLNALGETVDKIPTDGLKKSEKAAKKWGTSIKKFLKKYVDPFKEAFDQMGESVNSVFDAINDWIQVDIDKIADALDEITDKYNELSDAVENTEATIASLKEEYKTASASDRAVIGQKIADEEALLAQEKAAQNAAFQEQQRLDQEKQKLEKEQMKRQIEQQQFNAGISLINALISTAEGMSKEYAKGIFGIPTAVLIGVLGGIEVAAITAQIAALQAQKGRYANGGYIDDNGMAHGALHKDGGIDVKVGSGRKSKMIEIEGGEFVINRKSSKKYYNLLSEINDYGKTGKSITGLNQTKFASGGYVNTDFVNSALDSKSTEKQMTTAMEHITIQPKVSVVDIIRKTDDYNRVRAAAGR